MKNKMDKNFQDQFLDDMLLKAWFEKDDDLDLLKEDLQPLLQERIMLHIYQALNDDEIAEVTKFLNDNKLDDLDAYIRKIIPNYDDFLMEIYAQFEDEYLENMAA